MSYQNKPVRKVIPTPASASEELHADLVKRYSAHFTKVLDVNTLISSRKGCYATIINATHNGLTLEEALGSVNAQVATSDILTTITAKLTVIK